MGKQMKMCNQSGKKETELSGALQVRNRKIRKITKKQKNGNKGF